METSLGDLAALGLMIDAHKDRLIAMLQRRIDPRIAVRIDAHDVLQMTFLAAQKKWPIARGADGISDYAWLYRIALDTLIEVARRQTAGNRNIAKHAPLPEGSSMQLAQGIIDSGTSPSAAFSREENRQAIRRAVDLLAETDRQIIWMRHQDGLSHREIAAVLEVTENAATVRYARALQRLRAVCQGIEGESKW
jgi:RNA polymerase sigma-70 factor, ECF subfamily